MTAIATKPDAPEPPLNESTGQIRRKKTLGARFLAAGLINEAQLDLALREQRRSGRLLGEVLVDLGFVSAEVVTRSVAFEAQTEFVDVRTVEVDEEALKLVSYETAKRFKLMPLAVENGLLKAAVADAFNVVAIDHLERETGYPIDVVTAPENHILEAVARHYARGRSIEDTIDQIMSDGNLPSEDDAGEGSPLVRLVDQLIALGIKNEATDIHIEPDEKIVRVRMRIDGVLRQQVLVPKAIQPALTARIKLIANLNITEKRLPQDGRIRFVFGQNSVDLRVSTLPINCGESVVLRILDNSGSRLTLPDLGFSTDDTALVHRFVDQPYGMILVTGPTGSGKTTTLYTALGMVDTEQRSVFTLEDPIEYSLSSIRQTQVKPEIGMDFASGLRALLRQDPDVILIGEIRDLETAQLASRAALTGHLVLSTLHTNDSLGVIPRLVDMGVDRYLLPPALSAIVAQRLVRKICDRCKEEVKNPAELAERFGMTERLGEKPALWHGVGCKRCNQTGYQGREVIYEILRIDERFHEPIIKGASSSDIKALAETTGMRSMLNNGIDKALTGATTLDEVLRVVR